jgi:hypothetical protein
MDQHHHEVVYYLYIPFLNNVGSGGYTMDIGYIMHTEYISKLFAIYIYLSLTTWGHVDTLWILDTPCIRSTFLRNPRQTLRYKSSIEQRQDSLHSQSIYHQIIIIGYTMNTKYIFEKNPRQTLIQKLYCTKTRFSIMEGSQKAFIIK